MKMLELESRFCKNKNMVFSHEHAIVEFSRLKQEWLQTLHSAQDGMWETFRDQAEHWAIKDEQTIIGYACINEDHQLIQFYLSPLYHARGAAIFQEFIQTLEIQTAIVGTNNPVFASMALNFVKNIRIHTYLFRDNTAVTIPEKEGRLHQGQTADLSRMVAFYIHSIGAPEDWLNNYLGARIQVGEIFYFENNDSIIGVCEVRKSPTNPTVADIGMAIAPKFRKQGYGTYLLHQAKLIAQELGKKPICSCEKENLGSFKSISNSGFISLSQLGEIDFIESMK